MTTKKFNGRRTLAAILIASTTIIAGCNTIKGIGKDVEAVGEKTQEAAQKTSDKL